MESLVSAQLMQSNPTHLFAELLLEFAMSMRLAMDLLLLAHSTNSLHQTLFAEPLLDLVIQLRLALDTAPTVLLMSQEILRLPAQVFLLTSMDKLILG